MPKKRCWVCSYIDALHPFTLFQRWFYTKGQAEAWLARQRGFIVKAEIRHV